MEPVPPPHVLDPGRVLDNDRGNFRADHEARAEMFEKGFTEANDYARQLWDALAAARQYLWDSLPSDPRDPGPNPRLSAAPTGPDDEQGWTAWQDAFAGVTSVLCGPHGDSGFGGSEAREAARFRRDAPNLELAVRNAEADRDGRPTGAESERTRSGRPHPGKPQPAQADGTTSGGTGTGGAGSVDGRGSDERPDTRSDATTQPHAARTDRTAAAVRTLAIALGAAAFGRWSRPRRRADLPARTR